MERYTQLPDSLPQRVRDLAVNITEEAGNQYDRAKAIEEYLGSVAFSYDREDIAIPEGNQDYVDQFLFETFTGYCDNFSTSMIVLLRSIDIPARWVKGYTEGDFVRALSNVEKEYRITNNNAHSWVEIYFDGVGWVPFEPTQGFVNPYELTADYKNADENEESDQQETQVEKEEEPEETPEKPNQEEQDASSTTSNDTFTLFDIRLGSYGLYGILLVTVITGFIMFKTRTKWLGRLLLLKYRDRKDDDVFFQAYESLLKQFERIGLKKKPDQTLRDFAHYIDRYFQIVEMTALTKSYERALYRRDSSNEEWQRSNELWENLIKRTSS
nr:transglutaminase domain-containing protein [Metabacillus crassostreae]